MIRPIKAEEIEERRKKFKEKYPWAPEPQWEGVLVLEDNGKVVGMAEIQHRVLVATVDGDTPRATDNLMAAVDGFLCARGLNHYEFEVPDHNPKFQQFLESKRYRLKAAKRLPHKLYLIRRG